MTTEIKVFLASSSELALERVYVGDFFTELNSIIVQTPVRIRLLKWEVFESKYTGERKQNEYDEQVKVSNIFISLFHTRAGKYTMEEVEVAKETHNKLKRPKELYNFFKESTAKREFNLDELTASLKPVFVVDTYKDINDLKCKIINILAPHLIDLGVKVKNNNKFISLNDTNVLRV